MAPKRREMTMPFLLREDLRISDFCNSALGEYHWAWGRGRWGVEGEVAGSGRKTCLKVGKGHPSLKGTLLHGLALMCSNADFLRVVSLAQLNLCGDGCVYIYTHTHRAV